MKENGSRSRDLHPPVRLTPQRVKYAPLYEPTKDN